MKLISLNIEAYKHHDLVLPFLKKQNPDVVCLQELLEEDFEMYKGELGYEGIYKAQDYIYSKSLGGRQDRRYGLGIFSKFPIIASGYSFYVGSEENVAKPFEAFFAEDNFQDSRVLLWADIEDESGNRFRFVTTHFFLTVHGVVTQEQLNALDSLFEKLDPLGEFILCGDMNAPRGKETFDRLAKKYKDNIPLSYKTSIDMNLHRAAHLDYERLSTYVVDGLFTTPTYEAHDVKLVDGLSGHQAIVGHVKIVV